MVHLDKAIDEVYFAFISELVVALYDYYLTHKYQGNQQYELTRLGAHTHKF